MKNEMPSDTGLLRQHFSTLVTHIPLRHRLRLQSTITALQHALQLPMENLCLDRRSLRSDPTSANRQQYRASMKQTVSARKKFLISYRDTDGWTDPVPISVEQILRKTRWGYGHFHNLLSCRKGMIEHQLDEQTLIRITRRGES